MTQEKPPSKSDKKAATREDRLKNALKANLSRRKAQIRARSSDALDTDDTLNSIDASSSLED